METDILKEFENLINDKDYSKEIEIKNHKFLIKIGTYEEVSEFGNLDVYTAIAKNIVSIDNKKYDVDKIITLLKKMPAPIVNYLGNEISKFYQEKMQEFENIKKK